MGKLSRAHHIYGHSRPSGTAGHRPTSRRQSETYRMSTLTVKISCRHTFAIISQPDAGETTLTEKLLLFDGAIQLAG